MATRLLNVEIPEKLYDRLHQVVGTKLKSTGESYAKAIQSAVSTALEKFLDSLEENDKKNG